MNTTEAAKEKISFREVNDVGLVRTSSTPYEANSYQKALDDNLANQ